MVNKQEYSFTPEQCRLKVKSLKEKFERKKKKNNTSGESPASTDNDDMDEIFESIPDMKPKCIIDSGLKVKRKEAAKDDISTEEPGRSLCLCS